MTLNNEPVVLLIDKEESTVYRSQETEDYHLQQSSEHELSEDVQLQDSLDNRIPYFEDFDSPDEDSKNLDSETTGVPNSVNVLSTDSCHRCHIKSEEAHKLEFTGIWHSTVSTESVKAVLAEERPPSTKRNDEPKLSIQQIVHRQRPPRKPPDNNTINRMENR